MTPTEYNYKLYLNEFSTRENLLNEYMPLYEENSRLDAESDRIFDEFNKISKPLMTQVTDYKNKNAKLMEENATLKIDGDYWDKRAAAHSDHCKLLYAELVSLRASVSAIS